MQNAIKFSIGYFTQQLIIHNTISLKDILISQSSGIHTFCFKQEINPFPGKNSPSYICLLPIDCKK